MDMDKVEIETFIKKFYTKIFFLLYYTPIYEKKQLES